MRDVRTAVLIGGVNNINRSTSVSGDDNRIDML